MTDHLALAAHIVILATAFVNLMIAAVGLATLFVRLSQQDRKLEQIHTDVKNGNGKAHS